MTISKINLNKVYERKSRMAVAKFHSAVSTLNELIYYCKEPETVGALLLTGEWGCGKTYLIEHELREKLENEAIIIRISLFGISSLDEINFNIKKLWIESYCKNNIENEHAKKFTKIIKKSRES